MKKIKIYKKMLTVMLGAILSIVTCLSYSNVANAEDGTSSYPGAPGARAVFGGLNGKELFLGGNYIELGISQWGNFGTEGTKPANFRGSIGDTQIGLSVDYDGFGAGQNQPIDFYLPGDPEETFVVGYRIGSSTLATSNNALLRERNMPTTVTNESDISKGLLKAKIVSVWANRLEVTQVISFGVNDKFYRNEVTLKNLTGQTLSSARYMRSVDADNAFMLTGNYYTNNTVTHTIAEDEKAVVKAETLQSNDPIFRSFGTRSALFLYSNDPAAKASVYTSLMNRNPYTPLSYDSPLAKGTTRYLDVAITLAWESGGLAPAASKSFIYYTSLEDRDFGRHPITYSVIPVDGLEHGSLIASVEDVSINSNEKVVEGNTVEFTATPETGYRVKEWRQNGNVVTVDEEPLTEDKFTISNLQGPEDVTVEFEKIDVTPPVTEDNAPAGWQNRDVTITLSASDEGSEVAATYYQVNGGEQQTGTSVILTEEGTHTVSYWSEDAAGNKEIAKNVTVQIDKSAPITEASSPIGWQNRDVTVALNARDNGSGVAATYYQVNGGEQQTGTSVALTEEGTHTVIYWSEDVAGNKESAKTVTVQVDKSAPITEADAPVGWQNGDVTVMLNASDNGSGVAATYYQVNDGERQTGTSVVLTEDGTHTVTYWSEDAAGNKEAAKSLAVQIDKQAPILKVTPNTTSLWPANNKLVDITIDLEVDGGVSGIDSIVLVSITSNENHSENDIQGADYGTADTSFKLRATRTGKGQGRIYTIIYRATDLAGNTTEHSITIEVPHDQGNKK